MWPFCLANNPLWLLLPFLIGMLVGWWAWKCKPAASADSEGDYGAVLAPEKPATPLGVAGLTALGIPAAVGEPDNLRQIRGIGPALNTLLGTLGITRFDQIANWGIDEIAAIDGHMGTFKGRIVRDSWVEQARLLASGALAEFESRFGAVDSETNT